MSCSAPLDRLVAIAGLKSLSLHGMIFDFFCRFWAMRTSWLWSQWDRRMLGSTCAVLWSHVWERVKRRFLLPSTVGLIFYHIPRRIHSVFYVNFARTYNFLSLLHIKNKLTNPCSFSGALRWRLMMSQCTISYSELMLLHELQKSSCQNLA